MLFALIIGATAAVLFYENWEYKKSSYYKATKHPYFSLRRANGRRAEYSLYKSLRHFENTGCRLLFNLILPKNNGTTTEIDVLLICSKGLFVFESKDYSGWIFGNEDHKTWTQTLPQGKRRSHKQRFYNPIMQNAGHIRQLKKLVGQNIPMHSIIVFSDRTTLKQITLRSPNVKVTNNHGVARVISTILTQLHSPIHTETEINTLYDTLYPYSQLGNPAKSQHIKNSRRVHH